MPLVSVVIPMYRVASLLPLCIEQICRQTHRHLELIFVDDASPDEVSLIVEAHREALQQLGMRVLLLRHAENRGVAQARNTALEHATGEYLYSWDADDFLEPDALERMVQEAERIEADVIGCECFLTYNSSERRLHQADVCSGREAYTQMCKGRLKWNLWLFLIRRSLIERGEPLRFLPGRNMGEDMMFMGKVFLRAEKVSIIHEPFYHYVKTNAEAQTQHYTAAQWAQVDANLRELEQYVRHTQGTGAMQLLQYLKLSLKLPLLLSSDDADLVRWSEWYPEANPYIWSNDALPLRTKLLQMAAARRQWWAVRLYRRLITGILYKILYR